MANIDFSLKDRNRAIKCADGDAKQILAEGVLNPNHSDWTKFPVDRQKEILDTLYNCTSDAKDAVAKLKETIVSAGVSTPTETLNKKGKSVNNEKSLGKLDSGNRFMDTPLEVNQIQRILPKKYIGTSVKGVEYYLVEIPGLGDQILRINPNSEGDSLAIVKADGVGDFVDYIKITEKTGNFSCIEVQGSAGLKNLSEMFFGGVVGGGVTYAAGVVGGSAILAAGVTSGTIGATIGTLGTPIGSVVVGTVGFIGGATVGALTDLDLTTEFAKNLKWYNQLEVLKN